MTSNLRKGGALAADLETAVGRRRFRARLLAWYRRHARDLPWRQTRDPYAIWVSEVMLQQTQVNTVRDYYTRFLEAFPDVRSLAQAPEAQVLRLWEGLGYYRRARQLQAAARQVVAEHGGRFPQKLAAVRALPGIGRYTAGAVLSFAHDQRLPILEANTQRLWSRLVAYRGLVSTATGQTALWAAAASCLPSRGSGTFNQALIELGSQVCLPQAPHCGECPVQALCCAHRQGLERELPRLPTRTASEKVRQAALLVWKGPRLLLGLRTTGARFAGLWDVPRLDLPPTGPIPAADKIQATIQEQFGLAVALRQSRGTLRHVVTRFQITLHVFDAEFLGGRPAHADFDRFRFVRPEACAELPLSTTGRKLLELAKLG